MKLRSHCCTESVLPRCICDVCALRTAIRANISQQCAVDSFKLFCATHSHNLLLLQHVAFRKYAVPTYERLQGTDHMNSISNVGNHSNDCSCLGKKKDSHLLTNMLSYSIDKVRLQVVLSTKSFTLDAGLTCFTRSPPRLGAFITPDVNVLRGKQLHNLIQHRLQELKRAIFACNIDSSSL
jgi:hypothetical protein